LNKRNNTFAISYFKRLHKQPKDSTKNEPRKLHIDIR